MSSIIEYVGISAYGIVSPLIKLGCSALGSCVAVCLWDRETYLSGVVHCLMPVRALKSPYKNISKYVETGVPNLIDEMLLQGSKREDLLAKLVGGATLYQDDDQNSLNTVGSRNVRMAREILNRLEIPIISEHTGGNSGCSFTFDSSTMQISITVFHGDDAVI